MQRVCLKKRLLSGLLRLLMIAIFPAAAAGCAPCFLQMDSPEPKEIESDRVQGQFARWAMQNYGLEVVGAGGSMMDGVKLLSLRFRSSQRVSAPEARVLVIELIREFVRQINADKGIRPYLENYPATEENVWMTVSFVNSRNAWFSPPSVASISWWHRKVIEYFDAVYPDAGRETEWSWRDADLRRVRVETWQEAIQIVEQEEARVGFSPN